MQYWGLTDPGCVRSQNQDAYQIEELDHNTLVCIVCDGMGGAKSGNVASTLAIDVFVQEIKRTWNGSMTPSKIDQMLRGAVKLANFTVFDQAMQFEDFEGMGTTLTSALINGKKVSVVNVGDSRAYLLNRSGIRQLTDDHSWVAQLMREGKLTPEEAKAFFPLFFELQKKKWDINKDARKQERKKELALENKCKKCANYQEYKDKDYIRRGICISFKMIYTHINDYTKCPYS